MKTNTKLLLCVAGIAAALASAHSNAQNLTATFLTESPAQSVLGTLPLEGNTYTYYNSGVAHFNRFDAFCVDPYQSIYYNETVVYNVQNPSTLANSGTISRLVGGYLASDRTSLDAAAAQWAIWEVVADGVNSPSLSTGLVKIAPSDAAVAAKAESFLANVNSYTPAHITYLTSATRQDMITICTCVPEPGTALLSAFGALGLLVRRRR
jgi:hypothetical protein